MDTTAYSQDINGNYLDQNGNIVGTAPTVDSGTTAVTPSDNSGGGDVVNTILNNSGDLLTGAADLINAINGNGTKPGTKGSAGGSSAKAGTNSNVVWYVIVGVAVLGVILFIAIKK